MSFWEFVNFGDEESNDNTCAFHPLVLVPSECKECAFIHYKITHEAEPQMGGASEVHNGGPNHNSIQAASTQMAGTSVLPASRLVELPGIEANPSPFPNYLQPETTYAAPADILYKRPEPHSRGFYTGLPGRNPVTPTMRKTALTSEYPQTPRKMPQRKPFDSPVSPQLAMRTTIAVNMADRLSFKPRIISTTILSKTPIVIDPAILEEDDYTERFALSPTKAPKILRKLAPKTQLKIKTKGTVEYGVGLKIAKEIHESEKEITQTDTTRAKASQLFGFTNDHLRNLLKQQGLKTSGDKIGLIMRLQKQEEVQQMYNRNAWDAFIGNDRKIAVVAIPEEDSMGDPRLHNSGSESKWEEPTSDAIPVDIPDSKMRQDKQPPPTKRSRKSRQERISDQNTDEETDIETTEKLKLWRARVERVLPLETGDGSGKPYRCAFPGCAKRYTSYTAVMRHFRGMHQHMYKCPICQKILHSRGHKESHLAREHRGQHPLPLNRSTKSSEKARQDTKAADTESIEVYELEGTTDDDQSISDDDDDDGPEICEVCRGSHSEKGNDIILCNKCGLGFHQACYDVPKIPEGDWLCSRECQTQQGKPSKPKNAEEEVEEVQGLMDRRVKNGKEEFHVRWAAPYGPHDDQWLSPQNLRGLQQEMHRLRKRDADVNIHSKQSQRAAKTRKNKEQSERTTATKRKRLVESDFEDDPIIRRSSRIRSKRWAK